MELLLSVMVVAKAAAEPRASQENYNAATPKRVKPPTKDYLTKLGDCEVRKRKKNTSISTKSNAKGKAGHEKVKTRQGTKK
jgi:hypothetical protein